jgi:hypothetical protein
MTVQRHHRSSAGTMIRLAWRFLAIWVVLFVIVAALGAAGSVEVALVTVVALGGAFAWYFIPRKRRSSLMT